MEPGKTTVNAPAKEERIHVLSKAVSAELLGKKMREVLTKCGEYDELHLKYSWQAA